MSRNFAAEDGNLNTASIITARKRVYSDLNLLFKPCPCTGDVYTVKDVEAVKQSVKNLILTNYFEVPFAPFQGSNVRSLLFENSTPFVLAEIESLVKECIRKDEPRARVTNVLVARDSSGHSVEITVEFTIINIDEEFTITLTVDRIR